MDPIFCDDCGHEFTPRLTETRVKGGAQQRFGCLACGRIYPVAFITTTGIKLRKQLDQARRARDLDEHSRLMDAFQAEVTKLG